MQRATIAYYEEVAWNVASSSSRRAWQFVNPIKLIAGVRGWLLAWLVVVRWIAKIEGIVSSVVERINLKGLQVDERGVRFLTTLPLGRRDRSIFPHDGSYFSVVFLDLRFKRTTYHSIALVLKCLKDCECFLKIVWIFPTNVGDWFNIERIIDNWNVSCMHEEERNVCNKRHESDQPCILRKSKKVKLAAAKFL